MRALLQRVSEASVTLAGERERETGRIGAGLVALVGFTHDDDDETLRWVAGRIAGLRLFPGPGGEFDRSLDESGGGLLVVSQFTLYADARKGRRPDFSAAAPAAEAEAMYQRFCARCEAALPGRVAGGVFGARMAVRLINDGPLTLWLDRQAPR